MSKHRLILLMGWVTLLVFPAIALLVLYSISGSWQHIFTGGWPVHWQLLLGTGVGLVTGLGLRSFLGWKVLRSTGSRYGQLIGQFDLSRADAVFISVCAGVGEEILFRGCLQAYAGVWLTAVGFVALHGYLNPRDWQVSLYGLVLCLLFAGVGYLMKYTGLYTCMAIHIILDILLFDYLLSSVRDKN